MKCGELLGLTLDWSLGCSSEESVVTEISAWLPQGCFFLPVSNS